MDIKIETERLILRRLREEDAQDIFANYATDEEVTKYLTWNVHENIALTKSLLHGWIEEDDKDYPNITRFGITLKGEDKVIGAIDLVKDGDNYEIGYVLSRKYWNKAIMSEALNAFLKYLRTLGYKNVPIKAQVDNVASNKVISKFNPKFLGEEEVNLPFKKKKVKIYSYILDLDSVK